MERTNVILVTQARTGSTRLPGKVLLEIERESLLLIHLNRVRKALKVTKVIVATTDLKQDETIIEICENNNLSYFAGSENDVLDRFYQSVKDERPKWVVRVTSDCPLIDPNLIDAVISCAMVNDVDYCSNGVIENFPDGQDVEVFKFSALKKAWEEAILPSEREHVTPYIRNAKNGFSCLDFPSYTDYSKVRMTVDEAVDFQVIENLISALGKNASWLDYTNYIINTNISEMNSKIIRNAGYLKSLKNDK
ncbi:cytidylyltransferase domain-containing protein [Sphingobacterium detergens]|uniref:cytidylyltransferase domain-containing protein n=1 Tax=Sphingobacterium detergens TaxID=1145106 RepID=UPI003AAC8D37